MLLRSATSADDEWWKHSITTGSLDLHVLKSLAGFEKKPKVCLDDQGVLFEDEAAEGLVSKHRCSEFQNTSCIVVQLDYNSLWYL